MRGCALSLTTNSIFNSIPFLHFDTSHSQHSFPFPSQSLTIHNPTPSTSLSIHYHHPFSPTSIHAQQHQNQQLHDDSVEEEESFQILTSVKTDYNDIMIVETPNSRMLLLDSSRTYFISISFCLCFFGIQILVG